MVNVSALAGFPWAEIGSTIVTLSALVSGIYYIYRLVSRFQEEQQKRLEEIKSQQERTLQQILAIEQDHRETKKLAFYEAELLVQRRRLAEHNLSVSTSVELVYHHSITVPDPRSESPQDRERTALSEPYAVANVRLANIGDGPLDLLACMVAGREVSNGQVPGLGTQGRNVYWKDLVPYYWDNGARENAVASNAPNGSETARPARLFQGLSTTKNVPYAVEQLIRLDPNERDTLNRVDALIGVDQLISQGHVNLIYKVFTVVLGYPLAEIRNEVGVPIEGPTDENKLSQLYALDLARPKFHRWQRVQRALYTINRFPFRLALEGMEQLEKDKPEQERQQYYSQDPLGRLAEPTPWRCFLLYHWDFDELPNAAPGGAPDPCGDARRQSTVQTIEQVKSSIREHFNVYDPNENTEANLALARDYCRQELGLLVEAWTNLNRTIDYCATLPNTFADLIKESPYKERWEALRIEGYLLTNAGPEPADPLAIERYYIRTKYALVTLKAPSLSHEHEPR
jgi:hypothetical protein